MELTDHVEVLTSVVASQAETIKQQAATIDVLSGGRGKTLALEQTIAEMWAAYFETLPDMPWKKVAASTMKRFLAMHGAVRVGDFGALHWDKYRHAPEIREHYHVTTRNIQLIRIKAMFAWAVNTGQLADSPLAKVIRERPRPKRRTDVTPVDEATMLRGMSPVMRTIFVIAIDSGMRRNEIRTLEWKDIDLKSRTVQLPAQRTKTKQARTAYLTERATDLIKALPRYPGCPYVFASPHTRLPYSENYIWHNFRKAADENGIKAAAGDGAVRFHDLRHVCAVRLVRLGAPLPAVQEILGHADLATTSEYLFAHRKDVAEAHALLNQATRRGPMRAPGSAAAPPARKRRANS